MRRPGRRSEGRKERKGRERKEREGKRRERGRHSGGSACPEPAAPPSARRAAPVAGGQHGGRGEPRLRDGRLQQRGQAAVPHLPQAGHPGLLLLLSGEGIAPASPRGGGMRNGGVGACVRGVGGDPCAGGCPGLAAAAAPGLVPLRERGASVPPRPMEGPFGGPPFGFLGLDGAKRGVQLRVPLRLQQQGLVALPSSFAGSSGEARAPWGRGSAPCFFYSPLNAPGWAALRLPGGEIQVRPVVI